MESLDRMLDLSMPCAVLLSVSEGVPFAGCGCPSLIQAMRIGQQYGAPMYMPPVSASEAEATMFLVVWQRTSMRPFCFLLLIHTMWYMAAARLQAFGSMSKAALYTTLRIMSLAW